LIVRLEFHDKLTGCPEATDVGDVSRVISDGKNGILIRDPIDVKLLRAGITRLMSDKMLRERYGAQAYETVKGYSVDRYVRRVEKILLSATRA